MINLFDEKKSHQSSWFGNGSSVIYFGPAFTAAFTAALATATLRAFAGLDPSVAFASLTSLESRVGDTPAGDFGFIAALDPLDTFPALDALDALAGLDA